MPANSVARNWDARFKDAKISGGLQVDTLILSEVLKPFKTEIYSNEYVDVWVDDEEFVRIHLQQIYPENISARNYFIPNQELVGRSDLRALKYVEVVVCKTAIAYQLFKAYKAAHPKLTFHVFKLGFTSIAPPQTIKYRMDFNRFLHLAGQSPFKNTGPILQAWQKHPEWPELIVVCHTYCWEDNEALVQSFQSTKGGLGGNIRLIDARLPFEQVHELQLTAGVQLVPSQAEGWGHYQSEAILNGALCIYTNYPPMNEFFKRGEGIPVTDGQEVKLGNTVLPGAGGFDVSVEGVETAVAKVLSMSLAARRAMGQKARASYFKIREKFLERAEILKKRLQA